MRLFAIAALTLGCSILLPSAAQADCSTPEYCVCDDRVNTVLDAIIQSETASDTVWLEVLETFGNPLELPDDGVVELPKLNRSSVDLNEIGKRALIYIEDGAVIDAVLLDTSQNLECSDLKNPIVANEGAELALMGWEACSAAVREREGLPGTCDDDTSCSVGGSAPVGTLALLGMFGAVRRRRRE